MNWMGGSRSRFMKSSDMKKQKEFFEKRRMQKKLIHLQPPASPKGGNAGNIDLLTMFIVNQIALKKEHTGKPKIAHLTSLKGTQKCMGQEPLELPMSPCSPSRLSLVQSEPHYSVHTVGLKKRKQSLLEEFKFKPLSPVLEANQSDNSASDYKQRHHHHQGSVSSFSSASPTPSEAFQSKSTSHISSPSSWEPSCTTTVQFTHFSKPMGVYTCDPWATVPHQTQPALISPAAGAQFGRTLNSSTENNGPLIYSADDYPLNPSERNDQQDKPLFLGFSSEGYEGQDLFSERTIKIHLQEEPSPPPTGAHDFSESFNRDYSADFLSQPLVSKQGFTFADCRPCSAHSSVSKNSYEVPIGYSPRVGCISLDTTETQSVRIREKTSPRTRDTGTQTAAVATSTSQDVSVQCCLLKAEKRLSISTEHTVPHNSAHKKKKATAFTTRRQTSKSNESLPNVTQCTLSEIHKVKWNTPWKMPTTREATQQAPAAITGQESSCKTVIRACTSQHPLPTLHCSYANAPETKVNLPGNMVVRGERCEGHKEASVNQNPAEIAWSTEGHGREGVNWVSGETETLQEIADILLMLKQKNKHP
ncbi:hypothetical protein SRHO_G00004850 [Serrasalmus rhombeus]